MSADWQATLKGEGETKVIRKTRVRVKCKQCGKPAIYRHTFLLENFRNNPASIGYRRDDCSYCEDAAEYSCATCKPDTPDGYVTASRYTCGERFSHLFLEWEETEISSSDEH